MKKLFVLAMTIMSAMSIAKAQSWLEDPKFGNNPEERKENVLTLNYFNDAYQAKDYTLASQYLKILLEKVPKASVNIYINGANIYKNKIARATSVKEKNIYIDSLMLIYDYRLDNFGDNPTRGKAYILDMKARDYLTYKPTDVATLDKLFEDAIAAGGDNVDVDLINVYFQMLTNNYKADRIEIDRIISEYQRFSAIFDLDNSPERVEAKKIFDANFIASGAANCANLEAMFKAKIDANPNDFSSIEKAFGAMSKVGCSSDFYYFVAEKYYNEKPTSEVALVLAALYETKKEHEKALKFLSAALAKEENPTLKANLLVRIAGSKLSSGDTKDAANNARLALETDPKNAYATIILAQAYVSGASNCSGFDRNAAYWLIYDIVSGMRSKIDESDEASLSKIDSQLAAIRSNFPSKEECFFRGLSAGQGYNVNCGWVSGRTTVREGR